MKKQILISTAFDKACRKDEKLTVGKRVELYTELQKRANRANQLVLFFLAGANFWEKHAKNRQKHAKTGEKQRFFGANFFVGKIGRC